MSLKGKGRPLSEGPTAKDHTSAPTVASSPRSHSGPSEERLGAALGSWVAPELPIVEDWRYTVEGEYARGGLGRIIVAHDQRLGRNVAIKELIVPSTKAAARFVREAMVSARLQHPAIVPVYDAGRWPSGELFYTMKLISGRSLRECIDEARTLDDRLALLPHILAVADAMSYAHNQKIIHRDLKPSNVMVGDFGETVVIDWGLAKDLTQQREEVVDDVMPTPSGSELTVSGVVLGTPQYMPPEQARGDPVDERADVYSIGAILYHLLVGKSPYVGATPAEILTQVRSAAPPLLAALPAGVPKDLATIVRKAMARAPEDRYPSARELADDLRRFHLGQLVSAHEYSRLMLLRRWLERHRTPVLITGLCLAVLVVMSLYGVRRIVDERNKAAEGQRLALARSNELVLVQARTSIERDPTATLAWLKTYPPQADDEDSIRDLAIDALSRGVARHVFRKSEGKLSYSAASPDGQRLAVADTPFSLQIWNLRQGQIEARLRVGGDVSFMIFSPDGRTLAFVELESAMLRLWDLSTGKTRELPSGIGHVSRISFSLDGKQLLLSGPGDRVRLLEVASGQGQTFTNHEGLGLDAQLSPDGRLIAYTGPRNTIHVVNTQHGSDRVLASPESALILEFSPDNKLLLAAGTQGTLWLWDVDAASQRALRGHTKGALSIRFSRDGRRLLSASPDHTVRLWDVTSGTGRIVGEHSSEVVWAAFSPDERIVASAGGDTTVQLWYLETGDHRVLRGHRAGVQRVYFLGDGEHLMSLGLDRTTRIWRLPRDPSRTLTADDWVDEIAFSPDGHYLAVASLDSLIRRWDMRTGEAVTWSGHAKQVAGVAFSPDGATIASVSMDRTLRLWDAKSGASRVLTGHTDIVRDVAFSPDGRWIASAGQDGIVWLWEAATGQGRPLRGHEGETRSLAFSPDSRWIASAGADGIVWLRETATGQGRPLRGHGQAVLRLAFSHDGRLLVSGHADGSVRLWGVENGREWLLGQHRKRVRTVVFSPDDRLVASAGDDKQILLCEVLTNTCRSLTGHEDWIAKVDFSRDGKLLASAGSDAVVRLWDVATGLCLDIHRHDNGVTDVAFSPDGQMLASASKDRTVRLWRVDPMPAAPFTVTEFRSWLAGVTSASIMGGTELATP